MRQLGVLGLVLFVGLAMAACGGDDEDLITIGPDVTGMWNACWNDGGNYQLHSLQFSGGEDFAFDAFDHGADATCAGAGTPNEDFTGTYSVGAEFDTTLGGDDVTSYELDIETSDSMLYTIIYIDTSASPKVMYVGDDSGANDGSSADLRPTELDSSREYEKQ